MHKVILALNREIASLAVMMDL